MSKTHSIKETVNPPPALYRRLISGLVQLARRHPRALALAGFISGAASFLLVERKPVLAQVVALMMLASWLGLMFENTLRRNALRLLRVRVPRPALHFLTQMVHQESLFFVLPFFFFTLTWNSGQLVFMGLISAAALVSVIDPIYYNHLARRRWIFLAFHSLTLFAVLLTALPIILHLSTAQSYPWALGSAVVLAIPSVIKALPPRRWWRGLALVAVVAILGIVGWYGRLWVPPATLWLTDVSISFDIDVLEKAPGESVQTLTDETLHRQGLYAYTAIRAPRGLNERIYHVWRHDGDVVDRIALDISGGRKQGYRAWTHKKNFPTSAIGRWQVQVVTEANQMIGVLRFEVVGTDVNAEPPVTREEPASDSLPGETNPVSSEPETRHENTPDLSTPSLKATQPESEPDSQTGVNLESEAQTEHSVPPERTNEIPTELPPLESPPSQ